jgi:hypothetical protein
MSGKTSGMYYFKIILANLLAVTKKKEQIFQSKQPTFLPIYDTGISL